MSAKDRRKSLPLLLSPEVYAALGAYRRRHGARGMSSAARRCLRGALGRVVDMPASKPLASPFGRTREIRLQLERDLWIGLDLPDQYGDETLVIRETLVDRLQERLTDLGYCVTDECREPDSPGNR